MATTVFVVGTRAQLIKVAPVIVACEEANLPLLLLLTGQHQETMDDLMEEFGVRTPGERLVPAAERATVFSLLRWLPQVSWRLFRRLKLLTGEGERPSVLVHGDTLSTVLGAIAGWRSGARVVHLESGLSSGRLFDPFPEELSRRIVFRLTDVALCPTADTAEYMRRRHQCAVVDTGGNTIVDAVRIATAGAQTGGESGHFVASLHRFQNIFDGDRLRYLVDLLVRVSEAHPVHFVLHPATRKRLAATGLLDALSASGRVRLSPRLGYRAFLALAARAECVLTDGGSNQEELAVLGVPTIVMRKRTERNDGLGANALMEADLPGDGIGYLTSGGFRALRTPAHVPSVDSPSSRVAEVLAHLAITGSGATR